MDKRTIYAYSFKAYYEDRIAKGQTPWLKIGDTFRETDVRIGEQDTTSNPEVPDLKFSKEIPFKNRDYEVHKILEEKLGVIRVRNEREWFECDIDTVKKALNILEYGIDRLEDFEMRPEQKDAHDKIISYFKNGGKEFLLAAKMRFGKNFTMLNVMKSLEHKIMLVITYKPHVFNSIKNDLQNHVYFKDWNFIDLKECRTPQIDQNTPTVIVCSAQLALNKHGEEEEDFSDIRKNLQKLAGISFDIIMADEYHYGTSSENFKKLLNELDYKHIVYVSGTAMRDIEMGRFDEDQIYSWTYIDEQRKKQQGSKHHQMMPTMKMYLVQVSDEAKNLMEHYDEIEGFTLTKLFAADRKARKLMNRAALKQFLIQIMKGYNVHQTLCPYLLEGDLDHTFWVLPKNSVGIQETAALMRSIPEFEGYHIIEATANEVTTIKEVEKAIRRYPRTITLSCYRFKEGTTIPKWNGVLMLDDGSSVQEYLQAIFRCQNPNKEVNKQECYVFDFNPQRCLSMIYDVCENIDKSGMQRHLSEVIKEYLQCAPIFQAVNNSMEKIDFNVVMENFKTNGSYSEKFANVKNINLDYIDEDIIGSLSQITVNKRGKKFEINDNELSGAKNMVRVGVIENGEEHEEATGIRRDGIKKIIEKIQTVLSNIPEFLFNSEEREESVNDILNTKDGSLFEEITGIDVDTFRMWIEKKMINVVLLNRNIYYFLESEKEFLENDFALEEKDSFFNRHFNMNAEEGSTPAELVKEMMEKLPVEIWKNKYSKFCDPCGGTGNFILEIKRRLMEGLKEVIENEADREKWIIENMLWYVDNDRSKWLIAKKLIVKTNEFDHHIICNDSLKLNWKDMPKFDVVVGNPPFQDSSSLGKAEKLWPKFVQKAHDIVKNDGYVCMIIPASWMSGSKNIKKGSIGIFHNLFSVYKLFFVDLTIGRYFKVGSTFSYFLIQKTKIEKFITKWKTNDSNYNFDIRKFNFLPPKMNKNLFNINQKTLINHEIFPIIALTGGDALRKEGSDIVTNEKFIKTYVRGSNLDILYYAYFNKIVNCNVAKIKKVVIPLSGAEKFMPFIDIEGIPVCISSYIIPLEKKDTYEGCISVFNSKLFKILMQNNRSSGFIQVYVAKSLPKIDLSHSWTDQELYEYFKLTQEEIDYIESQIK